MTHCSSPILLPLNNANKYCRCTTTKWSPRTPPVRGHFSRSAICHPNQRTHQAFHHPAHTVWKRWSCRALLSIDKIIRSAEEDQRWKTSPNRHHMLFMLGLALLLLPHDNMHWLCRSQQIGLGITKAFTVHIRYATKNTSAHCQGTDNTTENSEHHANGPLSSPTFFQSPKPILFARLPS